MDRIDVLTVFVAVAELGSFIAASRRLGRSPAAITRAIAQLEDSVGVRLVNRTTRAVGLTEEGEKYLEQSRRVLADIEDLGGLFDGGDASVKGRLTLTAPVVFGRLHVLPLVKTFLDAHPGIEIHFLLLDRVTSLVDEGIDLGVRIGHLPDSTLRAIRVGEVRRVICASPDYLAAHGAPLTPQDAPGHSAIGVSGINPTPARWGLVTAKPRLFVNSVEAAVDMAVAGAGLTCLFSYQVDQHEKAGRLVRVLKEFEPPAVPIHILYPAGRNMSPKVRLFIDHAAQGLRRSLSGRGGNA